MAPWPSRKPPISTSSRPLPRSGVGGTGSAGPEAAGGGLAPLLHRGEEGEAIFFGEPEGVCEGSDGVWVGASSSRRARGR
jgi:hypothetical protein